MARFVKEVGRNYNQFVPEDGPGSGTVTSVGMSVPTGLSISGTPIVSSGVLALSYAAGYAIPTTIKQSNWDDAYTFVAAFPTQTGNSGKYLTTNGSALSWNAIAGSDITGAALTETDDTNVTMTLGGTPGTALLRAVSMTLGWAGQLSVARGGTGANSLQGVLIGNLTAPVTAVTGIGGQLLRANPSTGVYEFFTPAYMSNPMSSLGDIIYGNAAGAPNRLAANSTGNNMYLRSVSSGIPVWASIAGADITGAAMTSTNDTNIQITLGGTPNNSLLRSVSLTMGWTGQLAVGRGGTGASTLTGVAIGNGTSAMTAVAGTANQLLRRNALNTAYEFFTPSFPTGSGTVNYVPKWTNTTILGDSQIRDDGTNVGIGISPLYKLDVNGSIGMSNLPLIFRSGNYTNYSDSDSLNTLSLGNATAAANLYNNTTHSFRNRGGGITYLTINSTGISVTGSIYMTGSVLTGSWQASVISPTYGGTGASTITGVVIGDGISTMVGVAGTAGQLLRRNALNTAYEFFTPTYMNNVFTTGGDLVVSNSAGAPLRLAGNTTTTRKYLSQIGDGTFVTSTTWETVSGGGGISGSGTINYIPKFATSTSLGDSRILDNGTNIGIGDASPSVFIDAYKLSGGIIRIRSGDGGAFYVSNSAKTSTICAFGDGAGIVGGTADLTAMIYTGNVPLLFNVNASEKARITTSGYLGIATNNPQYVLDVNGNIGISNKIFAGSSSIYHVIYDQVGNPSITIGDSSTPLIAYDNTSHNFRNRGGSVAFATINASGARVYGKVVAGNVSSTDGSIILQDSYSNGNLTNIGSSYSSGAPVIGFAVTPSISAVGAFVSATAATLYPRGALVVADSLKYYSGAGQTVAVGGAVGCSSLFEILTTGQMKLTSYSTSTSFSGTAAGYLAFNSSGNVITVPVPSGGGGSSPYRIDFNSTMPDTWSNMPSAISFYDGSNAFITAAELTNFTQVRLLINKLGTAGAAGSIIILRYNTSYTQNANLWSTIGTTSVQLSVNNTNQFLETAWIDLVAGAKADVFIALMGSGGDGAADPIFGMITAEFR
jgi:hypothetical protein